MVQGAAGAGGFLGQQIASSVPADLIELWGLSWGWWFGWSGGRSLCVSGLWAELCCHLPCSLLLFWCVLGRELLPAVRARSDEETKELWCVPL